MNSLECQTDGQGGGAEGPERREARPSGVVGGMARTPMQAWSQRRPEDIIQVGEPRGG